MTARREADRRARRTMIAGGAIALLALAGSILGGGEALAGWLGAAAAFSAVPAGSLVLLLMMRLIPGVWGEELRLSVEAATLLTGLAALLFAPVLLASATLYPWARGAQLSGFQQAYLTPVFFALRTAGRFLLLLWIAARMRARRASVPTAAFGVVGIPLAAIAMSVDWFLSFDPKFVSSAFGLQFLLREITLGFCAALVLRLAVAPAPRRVGIAGALLLTLLLLWAYIEFLSFFIGWSPNNPEAAAWYLRRGEGPWLVLLWGWAIASAVPLLLLLFARFRASVRALICLALLVAAGKLGELAWIVLPGQGAVAPLVYGAACLGLGLVLIGALPFALRRRIARRLPKGEG